MPASGGSCFVGFGVGEGSSVVESRTDEEVR